MDTIFKRRSVRKYTDAVVSDEQIKQIIKAGMAAPSAKNSQEWIFIVIRDKEIYNAFM
ncbi:MAG: nitroreductase family protein, partial [Frisingicoccus sp.]|nr:nitroreductase family protein [Frisingicoccus sp.]